MHMKILHIAIVAMLFFVGHADAQVRSRHAKVHDADTVPFIVRSYVDSLQVGRMRVDSLLAMHPMAAITASSFPSLSITA